MVRSLREVTEVWVFLDTLGSSSVHHLKSIGLAHDVRFCGFALHLVTGGWHVPEGNHPTRYYPLVSSSDDKSLPSEVTLRDLPLSPVKTRPDPYFFGMKTRPPSTKFGSSETLVTILKCVGLLLTFEKWSKLSNSAMFHQFKKLNHAF